MLIVATDPGLHDRLFTNLLYSNVYSTILLQVKLDLMLSNAVRSATYFSLLKNSLRHSFSGLQCSVHRGERPC